MTADRIASATALITTALRQGGTLYACGNGGSAAQASHLVAELVGRFAFDRAPLRAVSLLDPGVLTCLGNDYGYSRVFARQVQALVSPGDVLVLLSTSGMSANIRRAVQRAPVDAHVVLMTGEGAPRWWERYCAEVIRFPGGTPEIQEATLAAIHLIAGGVERALFGPRSERIVH